MATIDLGRVIPLHRGVYSAATTYELNDVVTYNGNLYWCASETAVTGVTPGTDNDVWKVSFTGQTLVNEIQGKVTAAETAKNAAVTAKEQAVAAKTAAETSATDASGFASTAQSYAIGVTDSAKKYAEDAKMYRDSAQAAYDNTHTDFELAEERARRASEAAESAAQSEENAKTSERNADTSAANAAASVASIAGYATRAETAQSGAQTAAHNAQTYAGNASQSATAASNSATAAAQSATDAATAERNAAGYADEAEDFKDEIQSSLTQIETNRQNIATVTQDLGAETAARKAVDTAHDSRLNAIAISAATATAQETARATAAEAELFGNVSLMKDLLVSSVDMGITDEAGNPINTENNEAITGAIPVAKTDSTLTEQYVAADAKAVGDALNSASETISRNISSINEDLAGETTRATAAEMALQASINEAQYSVDSEIAARESFEASIRHSVLDVTSTANTALANTSQNATDIAANIDDITTIKSVLTNITLRDIITESGDKIATENGAILSAPEYTLSVPTNVYDWSDASSLHIQKPRLATANFILPNWPTSKTVELQGYIEFWDGTGNYFKKEIIATAQGRSSINLSKKSIKFDICNNNDWDDDDTFNLKIGDWVVQDSYHLKAYQTDRFRGVGAVAYELYDEIVKTRGFLKDRVWKKALIDYDNISVSIPFGSSGTISDIKLQTDSGARTFPGGFPCVCYLNGIFYGVFSWQLKKSRKNMQMTKKTATHIHLDGQIRGIYILNGTIVWNNQWEIRNPSPLYLMDGTKYDADSNYGELIDETSEHYDSSDKNHARTATVKSYLIALSHTMAIIQNAASVYNQSSKTEEDMKTFRDVFETYFDPENIIDYIIFNDIIGNGDSVNNNWQWAAYTKAKNQSSALKWYICPYDLDLAFGNNFQGRLISPPRSSHIGNSDELPTYYVIHFYTSELNARYKELRKNGILTAEHVLSLLLNWCNAIGTDIYEMEFDKWPLGKQIGTGNYYTGVVGDNIYRVCKWIAQSISNMDALYQYT